MEALLREFTDLSREILGQSLVGVYLHGSAAMGCFNPGKSDLDLLIVVENTLPDDVKRRCMDMVVRLNESGPAKGIEMSIIRRDVCRPLVYPTPFELHFSVAHLDWFRSDPDGYVRGMKGTDRDLAAHVQILYHRGRKLFGAEIREVFGPVLEDVYFDSIRFDIETAAEDVLRDPMYMILNLCRVLAYKKDRLILSKQEGGQWGMEHIPEAPYRQLIAAALEEYGSGILMRAEEALRGEFARYMLDRINN